MSDVLEAAGSMGMVVAGLGGLGVLLALALAGLGFTKRRVPLAAFVFLPFMICVMGAIGAWSNAGAVLGSLSGLEAGQINEVALAGLWQSVTIDWLSLWVAAGVLVVGTWCAGIGATLAAGSGDDTALTPVSAASAAVSAIVGSIALGAYGVTSGLTTEAYMLAGLILIGGLGVAFASSRRALYEHAYRVAGMRFTAAACFAISSFFAAQAVSMGAQIAMFGPSGRANGESIDNAVRMWGAIADPVFTMSVAAFLIALVIAFLGMYSELGEIVQRYTLIDVWATIVLILVLVGARSLEASNTTALADVGTHMPATQIYASWGTDLPSAVVTVEKEAYVSRPLKGGYGDVLAFRPYTIGYKDDGTPATRSEWRRIWAWTGSSWVADDSPLSCEGNTTGVCTVATLNTERTPLLAIGKGETATDLMIGAKAVPDGRFMLLMKALDADGGSVPSQLAHGQVTFIAIDVEKEVDLMKEVWVDAGYKQMFWGPTHWFGEGEDKAPVLYAQAIVEDTGTPGIHVLVSEKARVEGVANSCVAAAVDFADGETSPSDIWCSVVDADVEDWRAQAREVWPIPEPETVDARVVKIEGPVDEEHVEDVFLRETGAVAHCQELAFEKALEDYDPDDDEDFPMAPTSGRIDFSVVINDRGRINGTYTEDTSRLDNREIAGCVANRYRKLSFDPLPKPPVVEGEPKPEPPSATVYITYDFAELPDPEEE